MQDLKELANVSIDNKEISQVVSDIIANVKAKGDAALFEYAEKFDKASLNANNIAVSKEEIAIALKEVSTADKKYIKEAIANVKLFHKHTMPKKWRAKNGHGAIIGENFYPIERVGLYIPGGQVPLVSSVVMTAVLAKQAGCPEICVCTPVSSDNKVNSHLLTALALLGIDEIYKIGGAQAIAAMSLGTESVKAVDKLFGPGNAFVIEAKRQMFGVVGCDLLPGPSEVLVLADSTAKAKFIAADLLSQAEHGSGKEKIFFVTTSKALVAKVLKEVERQAKLLSRREKLEKIIDIATYIIHCTNMTDAALVANYISPEHMEFHVDKKHLPFLEKNVKTAGAMLIGDYTPTVLGDFTAGPSHTLPTGRTGRFSSGLQAIDFMRRSSYVKYDEKSAKKAMEVVDAFARMEKLDAHGNSLKLRA